MGKLSKKGRYEQMIATVLKESKEPLTTREIIGRMVDRGYRMIPGSNQASQIMGRSRNFVKVEMNAERNLSLWKIKEEFE